jgi:hypothetical protein
MNVLFASHIFFWIQHEDEMMLSHGAEGLALFRPAPGPVQMM